MVGKLTDNMKLTEDNITKAEFNIILEIKTYFSKTPINPEVTSVRASMRREKKDTAPEGDRPVFDKLSIRSCIRFVPIAVPIDLGRIPKEIFYFGYSSTTKLLSNARVFLWPEMPKDIEQVNDRTACQATGKNLKYQISKNQHSKLEKLTELG